MNGSANCYGKKIFRTYWQANRNAHGLNRFVGGDAKANAYKCSTCGQYHVGNHIRGNRVIGDEKRGKRTKVTDEDQDIFYR